MPGMHRSTLLLLLAASFCLAASPASGRAPESTGITANPPTAAIDSRGSDAETTAAQATSNAPVWMARDPDTGFRVLSWNVARRDFFADTERTGRLLNAAAPDVLLLDEMPLDATVDEVTEQLARALPGVRWHVVLGEPGGNRERGSISSRWPLVRAPRFDHLTYTEEQKRRWIERAGSHAARLRDTLHTGVATAGAIADIDGMRVLFVSFDLQCCGDDADAWEEERRQVEARLIRGAVDATLAEQAVDAVVLGGDANNVQNDTIIRILQGPHGDLANTAPQREDGTDWTWDGRGTPFASKKIDHLMHSANLVTLAARILDTEWWPDGLATALRLTSDASRRQSPHRPIVVDFATE